VTVRLETEMGDIDIKLQTKKAPITANNFLHYVDAGKLNGADFWRAADSGPSGFIQATANGPTFPPIAHEPTSQTGLSHTNGAISMSRFAPGTATADFVLCVGDNTFMDAGKSGSDDKLGYAAFGHVVAGMDVVKKILHGRIDPKTPPQGGWAGQMLLHPVKILKAERISEEPDTDAASSQ
jgi:peptidyl-prolyl cis-trans isomerase A (cyclophilin A)